MRIKNLKIFRQESGNVIIIAAVSVIFFLLMVAVVVDIGILLFRRVQLQNAADAAALAAAGYWGEEYASEYMVVYEVVYNESTAEAHEEAHQSAKVAANEVSRADLKAEALRYVAANDPDGTAVLDDDGFDFGLDPDSLLNNGVIEEGDWKKGGWVRVLLRKEEPLIFGRLVGLDYWSFSMKARAVWEWSWEYANPPGESEVEGKIRTRLVEYDLIE